jgi:hypothetical protein
MRQSHGIFYGLDSASCCSLVCVPGVSVANMASYAISSSLILVIHDNVIIGTNHIV